MQSNCTEPTLEVSLAELIEHLVKDNPPASIDQLIDVLVHHWFQPESAWVLQAIADRPSTRVEHLRIILDARTDSGRQSITVGEMILNHSGCTLYDMLHVFKKVPELRAQIAAIVVEHEEATPFQLRQVHIGSEPGSVLRHKIEVRTSHLDADPIQKLVNKIKLIH